MEAALERILTGITNILRGIGLAALVLGIGVGGLMRMFAYGSERRIAMSNVALSCAVVGFIVVMLAQVAGTFLNGLVN